MRRWLLGAMACAALLPGCKKDTPPAAIDAGTPLVAATPTPDAGAALVSGTWALVLLSPETKAEADEALPELTRAAANWVEPAPGFPRVVDSSTIKGFKPGYHVVVLGFCEARDTAMRMTAWVKLEAPKAYFKWVAPQPEACPRQSGRESYFSSPQKLWAAVSADSDAGTRLVAVGATAERKMDCAPMTTVVQLRRGATLLDEHVFEGECRGACTPESKAEGEAQVKEIEAAIERGEASESELDYDFTGCQSYDVTDVEVWSELGPVLWVFNAVHGPHDVPLTALHVFGPGCAGGLAHTAPDDLGIGFAAPALADTKGNTWRRFQVAADVGERTPVATFVWRDGGCGWEVEAADAP